MWRVPAIFHAPTAQDPWSGCGETAVMIAGAWVLYAWFAADWDKGHLGFAIGENGLHIARITLRTRHDSFRCCSFHLSQRDRWAHSRLAAMAYVLGVFLWLYLPRGGRGGAQRGVCTTGGRAVGGADWHVHAAGVGPIIAAGSKNAFVWSETILSAALTAGAWVVADSYRGNPWLAVNRRDGAHTRLA